VSDVKPEAKPTKIKDPAGSGKYIDAYPVTISDRQQMLSRVDENGEPNDLELHLFKHKLKTEIGAPILDVFMDSDAYQTDVNNIRNLIEEHSEDLSVQDAINIYDAVLKFVSEHGYMPTPNS